MPPVPAGAGAGNLLTRIPGAPREDGSDPGYVMFCAHLDTVPHDGPIEVVLDDDEVYRSAGDTILGADNKAAVAVLMEMAARAAVDPPPIGLELLFTVAEEQGLRGAAAFDQSLLRSKVGFVLDHATALGEVITAAPTHIGIRADFKGVEAHAGLAPGIRPLRDRGCRQGDQRNEARPDRRRNHRKHRADLGRHLRKRDPRPLPGGWRGEVARPGPGDRGDRGDDRRDDLVRLGERLRGRRRDLEALHRIPGRGGLPGTRPRRRGAASAGATSRSG